jgi:hypothetical protein
MFIVLRLGPEEDRASPAPGLIPVGIDPAWLLRAAYVLASMVGKNGVVRSPVGLLFGVIPGVWMDPTNAAALWPEFWAITVKAEQANPSRVAISRPVVAHLLLMLCVLVIRFSFAYLANDGLRCRSL